MKQVEIYSSPLCGFCHAAKRLLNSKSVKFAEYNILTDPDLKPEMIKRAGGARTVPQIFVEGTLIGGCDDLFALEQTGKLDTLLGL